MEVKYEGFKIKDGKFNIFLGDILSIKAQVKIINGNNFGQIIAEMDFLINRIQKEVAVLS